MATTRLLTVQSEMEPTLVSMAVAAALLGVSVFTIRRLIERDRLTPIRFGRAVRLRRQELERLVDELAGTAAR